MYVHRHIPLASWTHTRMDTNTKPRWFDIRSLLGRKHSYIVYGQVIISLVGDRLPSRRFELHSIQTSTEPTQTNTSYFQFFHVCFHFSLTSLRVANTEGEIAL